MKHENSENGSDRRRSVRFDTTDELSAVVHGVQAEVHNISLTGACVKTAKPIPDASRLHKPTFFMDNRSFPVDVGITLRWTVKREKDYESGVEFNWQSHDRSPVMPVLSKFLS